MKDVIYNVYKNKKWITLGLSILYLLLFCFPLVTYVKSYDETTYEITLGKLPYILHLLQFIIYMPSNINAIKKFDTGEYTRSYYICNFATNFTCCITTLIVFITAIVCVVRLFKSKKFQFVWSLAFAFLTMLIYGIWCGYSTEQGGVYYRVSFYPTTYIFLILLILDVVYLCLERYYVHGGQEKLANRLAERKSAKQAQQEAAYKQSPEYRIEQLEKELQELKEQRKPDDRQ